MITKKTTRRGDLWYSPRWDTMAVIGGWVVYRRELVLIVDLGHPVYCFIRSADDFAKNYVYIGRGGRGIADNLPRKPEEQRDE